MAYRAQNPVGLLFHRGNNSGSLAIFTAIRRVSSLVSSLAISEPAVQALFMQLPTLVPRYFP
jgi:hypothetical protein